MGTHLMLTTTCEVLFKGFPPRVPLLSWEDKLLCKKYARPMRCFYFSLIHADKSSLGAVNHPTWCIEPHLFKLTSRVSQHLVYDVGAT